VLKSAENLEDRCPWLEAVDGGWRRKRIRAETPASIVLVSVADL